jgi:hypothetical protein
MLARSKDLMSWEESPQLWDFATDVKELSVVPGSALDKIGNTEVCMPFCDKSFTEDPTNDINRSDMDFCEIPGERPHVFVAWVTGNQGTGPTAGTKTHTCPHDCGMSAAGVVNSSLTEWLQSYFKNETSAAVQHVPATELDHADKLDTTARGRRADGREYRVLQLKSNDDTSPDAARARLMSHPEMLSMKHDDREPGSSHCVSSDSTHSNLTLSVCVAPASGMVESLYISMGDGRAWTQQFNASLSVDGCVHGDRPTVAAKGSAVEITHQWRSCTPGTNPAGVDVVQRLTPFKIPANSRAPPHERTARAAIKLEAILSPTQAVGEWSAAVVSSFGFASSDKNRQVWMAAGRPAVSSSFDPLAPWSESKSPETMMSGMPTTLLLGGDVMGPPGVDDPLFATGGLALPMVTWLESEAGWGLSLTLSPDDRTVYNQLSTPGPTAPEGFMAHADGYWSNGSECHGPSTVPKQHPPCKPWHPTTIDSCARLCNASDVCRAFEVYYYSASELPKYCWLFMDRLEGFTSNSMMKTYVKSNASAPAETGQYSFTRTGSRFTRGVSVNLTALLVLHEPDWRPALAALRDTFTEYFYANETVNTSAFDGLMAYADYRGDSSSDGGGPTDNTSIPFETLRSIGMMTNCTRDPMSQSLLDYVFQTNVELTEKMRSMFMCRGRFLSFPRRWILARARHARMDDVLPAPRQSSPERRASCLSCYIVRAGRGGLQ